MAIVWIEGFESYGDMADLRRGMVGPNSTTSGLAIVAGRYGGQALECNSATGGSIFLPVPPASTYIGGVAWRQSSGLSLVAQEIISFRGLSNFGALSEHVSIDIESDGSITANRTTTELGSSSAGVVSHNTWHYIEAKVFISNTVGTVDVYVDGSSVLSLTSQDTQNNSNRDANIIAVGFMGSNTNDSQRDDIYIADTTGLTNNDILVGPLAVETLTPNADGTTNNFTPLSGLDNYAMVDDGSSPDDDTTYVSSGTVSDQDLYAFSDMSGYSQTIDSVVAVEPMMHLRKEHSGARIVRTLARNGLTTTEGADQGCGTEYRYIREIYETDPDGGGAWDETAVNSAEFGIKIQS